MYKLKFTFSALLLVLFTHLINAQQISPMSYLNRLPDKIVFDKSVKRSYQMITDYYNYNLRGDFLTKKRIIGTITYGLDGDFVKWNNVSISDSRTLNAEFSRGVNKGFMENFTYIPSEEVLKSEFFRDNLPEADPTIMNHIWDALALDVIAYTYWDSLSLNKEFQAKGMNSELEIANIGTFENKDIRITWLGITEMNKKPCAILKYSVLNNPLRVEYENVSMVGRSHYWGEIYVSLLDMQIEQANLTEDVLTDMKIQSLTDNILGYTVRIIHFERVK